MKIQALLALSLSFSGIIVSPAVFADEPSFCTPESLQRHRVAYPKLQPSRARLYRLGKVTVTGMAIGGSLPTAVRKLALEHSDAGYNEGYCTWYVNDANPIAAFAFNFHPLPHPTADSERIADIFIREMGSSFHQDKVSFLSCAQMHGYIGLGCDGMMHRGPTLFAMLLAYAGCTPENSAAIANQIWGENGVPTRTRVAAARRAAELAEKFPVESARLRALFEGE